MFLFYESLIDFLFQFYEMFEKDADVGHRYLHLKMTDRTNMRMCGIPEGQVRVNVCALICASTMWVCANRMRCLITIYISKGTDLTEVAGSQMNLVASRRAYTCSNLQRLRKDLRLSHLTTFPCVTMVSVLSQEGQK